MASIKQRSDNTYQITVSMGYDINGKKLIETTTFTPPPGLTPKKLERAVQDFARKFEDDVRNGVAMDGRKITLKAFVDRWKTEYAPQHLSPRTIQDHLRALDGRLLPALGHLKLTELRPAVINSFFVDMTKDGARKDGKPGGYSKATIKRAQDVLSGLLRVAVEWELIEKNPMDKIRTMGEDPADKIEYFTLEETAAFLDFIEKPYQVQAKGHRRTDDTGKPYTVGDYARTLEVPEQLRVLFNLAIYGGLRKGELLALEWGDFDFENDTVRITKAVTVVGGEQLVKEPKTRSSRRTIALPHELVQRVKRLKVERMKYRLKLGTYWQGAEWVFIQDNGRQMSYSTPYSSFRDILSRYNATQKKPLPLIPFHGLRHTHATLLISGHTDVRTVASRLGHAETSTTMNIYAHSLEKLDKTAVNTLEIMLEKHA